MNDIEAAVHAEVASRVRPPQSQSREASRRRSKRVDVWTAIAALSGCLGALFAGWAAWETRTSANEAANGTRANVWLQLLTEYSQPEMLTAMRSMRDWQRQATNSFARDFRNALNNRALSESEKERIHELDSHRRRVGNFFNKVRVLTEGGIIDQEFVAQSWASSAYTFIADVLIPLEMAKVDALRDQGSITEWDYKVNEALGRDILEFYRDCANMSLLRVGITNLYQPK